MSDKSTEQRLREALKAARDFIKNGRACGSVIMPDGPDSAHDTPGIIDAALALPVTPVRREYLVIYLFTPAEAGSRGLQGWQTGPISDLSAARQHRKELLAKRHVDSAEIMQRDFPEPSPWRPMEEKD